MVKEFLSRQGVEFSVRNVAVDPEAREEFLRAGYRLPPVTVIDGIAVHGYKPRELEELLWAEDSRAQPL
ncbi:MAG: glutaredoxin family protein [Dehalococcoidia bacterium]